MYTLVHKEAFINTRTEILATASSKINASVIKSVHKNFLSLTVEGRR